MLIQWKTTEDWNELVGSRHGPATDWISAIYPRAVNNVNTLLQITVVLPSLPFLETRPASCLYELSIMSIRLVTFDALATIIAPRLPIYVQYSQTFEPYIGVLDPDALKKSFKTALKQLQESKPAYQDGAEAWWGEVIRRTAVGAGAKPDGMLLYLLEKRSTDVRVWRRCQQTSWSDSSEAFASVFVQRGIQAI